MVDVLGSSITDNVFLLHTKTWLKSKIIFCLCVGQEKNWKEVANLSSCF